MSTYMLVFHGSYCMEFIYFIESNIFYVFRTYAAIRSFMFKGIPGP